VHRDIKPGNVMLTRAGEVKVMDFGIARAASDASSAMTQTSAVIGTAAYLSPEQARGEHVDSRSDLYSTGCLLYELITGAPPFTGDSPVAVAYQHVREDPQPPSAYDETLPASVDAVVLKAMAKNPANRYQSAQEMREDLLRAGAGQEVLATPVLEPVVVLAPAAVASAVAVERSDARKRAVAYSVFGLVLAAIVFGIAVLVKGVLGADAGLVPAPPLVGLSQGEAVARAGGGRAVGRRGGHPLRPQAVRHGARAEPAADILLRSGGAVSLVLSKGMEMTIVPVEVVGLSREEARSGSASASSWWATSSPATATSPRARCSGISPQPGVAGPAQSKVTLTVASGQVQVPDVRGKSAEEAAAQLQRAGFSVGIKPREDPGPPDRVLDQSPVNTLAPRGSTVVIEVSQTPAPPSPQPSPQPSPSASPASPAPEPEPSPSP
jgi:serine/threonine-protein kinase